MTRTSDGPTPDRFGRGRRGLVCCGIPALSWLVFSGCASPEPKYQPPVETDAVCINAEDLGLPPDTVIEAGSPLMSERISAGRFPTGVSVVRVEATMHERSTRRCLRVADMPQECAVLWCQLWDDLPPIREVTTLRTLGLDPRGARFGDLLRESEIIDCDLCLIYARLSDTDADADFIAVLWDAADQEVLAAFRVPVVLTEEDLEASKEEHRDGYVTEAEFRAVADLRNLVRDAVWDLVAMDRGDPTTQPSPWREYLPVFPRDYDRFHSIKKIEKILDRAKEQ